MLETSSQTVEALWRLHDLGVRIALDDFGTGYSSLSYLRRFPFDKIKIDRSFIHDLGYEKDDSSIILAIIGLAERMNMVVTAEGVETADQAALLTSYGCAQAQGYLFHRPLPGRAIRGSHRDRCALAGLADGAGTRRAAPPSRNKPRHRGALCAAQSGNRAQNRL